MKFHTFEAIANARFRNWIALMMVCLACLGVIWVLRLIHLQAISASYYKEVSRGNRIRVAPLEGPRGVIYDRNARIIAYNRASFALQFTREDALNQNQTLQNLSQLTNIPLQHFENILRKNAARPVFKPVVLLKDVGRKVADIVDTYQEDLSGISLKVEFKRLYPEGILTPHAVGYVGSINPKELHELPANQTHSGRVVGRSGVERIWNTHLLGVDGGRQVEVDHLGRVLKVIGRTVLPQPGQDLYLSLDLRLQRYIYELMGERSGVVLVTKPLTGEMVAMVSLPQYDPNLFVEGLGVKEWELLVSNKNKPLINKAVQGQYPPGSTFKMAVAIAALEEKVINSETKLNCPGHFKVGKRDVRYCWKRTGHGEINLKQAIARSCNVFFYQLGQELGVNNIHRYAKMLGFGSLTGVPLESEKKGLLPSREWKQKTFGERWFDGETAPVSIGQGFLTVTPIQLLYYVNALANDGVWVPPRLSLPHDVRLAKLQLPSLLAVPAAKHLPFALEHIELIRRGMRAAVNSPRGTALRAQSKHFAMAGKTGTSEVVGRRTGTLTRRRAVLNKNQLPHSLFVGYAPFEAPRVSVLVLIEHGEGGGGEVAAPVARKILEFYDKNIQVLTTQPETTPGLVAQ